jgi:Primase C terminal 2 (PriCT-2)
MSLGATLDEWLQFDFTLGLGKNLLPCVPASPDVKVVQGSAIEGKVGKIPSMFNGNGEAHGITGWQKREIADGEVAYWSKDRRLNLCVRTGPISEVYAFDIDIDDDRASDAHEMIELELECLLPQRVRDSHKRLLMFRMEEPCKKRKIKLDENPRGPAIELLADGQQFVACGLHSSGSRYQWWPELPSFIPTITLAQLDSIWSTLTTKYAKSSPTFVSQTAAAQVTTETETLTQISEEDWTRLIECLRFLVPHAADEQVWAEIGMALLSIKDCGKPVRQLWLDFSKKSPNWEEGAAELWWEGHIT